MQEMEERTNMLLKRNNILEGELHEANAAS